VQDSTVERTASTLSFPRSIAKNVLRDREILSRIGARAFLHLLRERLLDRLCIWRAALGSLRGHIRSQSARGRAGVDFGPALVCQHSGHLCRNTRTIARILYTKKLLASLSWADSQDLEIFLMGFDAGEQWGIHNEGTVVEIRNQVKASWLTSEDGELIRNEIRKISNLTKH